MNVLCINSDGWAMRVRNIFGFGGGWIRVPGPKLGDEDRVISEAEQNGRTFYELGRWPGGRYDSNFFVPLDDSDETGITREPIKKMEPAGSWPIDKALKNKNYV